MSRNYRLEREQFVPRPLPEVFAFFSDAANLERLTPPSVGFRILSPLPIEMKPGAVIDYRIRLLGIPFHWRTLIEEFEPGVRFVDSQAKGPYASWRHSHEFEAVEGGTLMRDRVDYSMPLGPLGALGHALFAGPSLRKIFNYRNEQMQEIFPPGQ